MAPAEASDRRLARVILEYVESGALVAIHREGDHVTFDLGDHVLLEALLRESFPPKY